MAKAGHKASAEESTASAGESGKAADKVESTAAYWKRILLARPKLIRAKGANETLRQIWLKDHPDHTEVPANIVANLANVKTQLRNKRNPGKRVAATTENEQPAAVTAKAPGHQRALKALEERIDDCLMLARDLNQPELGNVIDRLRRARNEVVVQIGE